MKRLVLLVALAVLTACASSTPPSADEEIAPSKTVTQSDALYSLTLMRQGSVLLQQGRNREALKTFEDANRIAPGNATVHNMIGICHLRMEEYEAAMAAFDRALRIIPSFTDARNNRGAAYLALGQYRMAEVDFLAVLGDTTYPHRWEAYYNLGQTYLRRDELGAAEENFRRAADAPTPVYEAFLRLTEVYLEQGKLDMAVDVLEDAKVRFPERTEVSLRLGSLLLEQGREDEARRYLEEVIEARPDSQMAVEAAALLGSD